MKRALMVLAIPVVAVILLLVAGAPAHSQEVYVARDLPTGPVKFVAPDGAILLSDRLSEGRAGNFLPGDSVIVVTAGWQVQIQFFDPDDLSFLGFEVTLNEGERAGVCATIVVPPDTNEFAVESECSCIFPNKPTFPSNALTWSSGDPSIATITPLNLCGGDR